MYLFRRRAGQLRAGKSGCEKTLKTGKGAYSDRRKEDKNKKETTKGFHFLGRYQSSPPAIPRYTAIPLQLLYLLSIQNHETVVAIRARCRPCCRASHSGMYSPTLGSEYFTFIRLRLRLRLYLYLYLYLYHYVYWYFALLVVLVLVVRFTASSIC
jgi:hypothetical protein